jgi:hypothetical protein
VQSLGLGSTLVPLFIHVITQYAIILVPFWYGDKEFGVMGLELRSVDSDSSGLCLVHSESLWLVIMPKSMDPVRGKTTHENSTP